MKLKKKDYPKIIGVGLVLVIALVVMGGGKMPFSSIFGGTNFLVKSISTSQVISNDNDIAGAWFWIDTTLGSGQVITGVVDPATFKAKSGYETQKQFKITANTQMEMIDYSIVNDARTIYSYSVSKMASCPTGTAYDIEMKLLGIFTVNHICVQKLPSGIKGHFNNPNINFATDVSVQVGTGTPITRKIGSQSTSATFTDSANNQIAIAQWAGSLVTGDAAPNQDNYVPYFRAKFFGDTEKWYVAMKDDYTEWIAREAAADSQLQQYVAHPSDFGCSGEDACVNIIKNLVAVPNAMSDKVLNSDYKIAATQQKLSETSLSSGAVRVYLNRNLNNPNILFKVRASSVGVIINTGMPDILSVSSSEFGSGETGIINVEVMNIGTSSATFSATFSGCDPFIPANSAQNVGFAAGETKNIILQVSHGAVNTDLTKTCTVKVSDFNNPTKYDTASVSVSMTAGKICVPDKYEPRGDCVWRCNAQGTDSSLIECCDKGLNYESGKAGSYDGYFCNTGNDVCATDVDCDDKNPDTLDRCEATLFGFGAKKCNHYQTGTCWTDSECNDDKIWTADTCEGAIQLVGKRGACKNDLDGMFVGGVVAALLVIMGGVYIAFKK